MRGLPFLQKLRRGGKRIRHAERGRRIGKIFNVVFVDDEAAAHRVIHFSRNDACIAIERGEAHAVAVEGERFVDAEAQIFIDAKRDRMLCIERELVLLVYPLQLGFDLVRIDSIGCFSRQSEQHRAIGAVPASCQRKRAVEIDRDAGCLRELAVMRQRAHESQRGAHRSHRVRARWSEADLEEIKCADEHRVSKCRW